MEELLELVGWTKVHFSKRIGVSEASVRDWSRGRHRGNAYKVAMAYLRLCAGLVPNTEGAPSGLNTEGHGVNLENFDEPEGYTETADQIPDGAPDNPF
jgi:hypothetical protein